MSQNIIYVYAGWENDKKIGTIYSNISYGEETVSFEYDKQWLTEHPHLILDPTIEQTPYRIYSKDKALFGAFQDACPDRWGRKLIDRREVLIAKEENRHPRKFVDSEYMLGIQDVCRSGGYRFKTNEKSDYIANENIAIPPISTIRELEQISLGYEIGNNDRWISQLVNPGSSLGGARPKANVLDTDGSMWIAKFPSRNDTYDVGAWEKVVHDLANKCGINVPESRLCKYSDLGSTFLVKRFDRDYSDNNKNEKRIHFASAMTMLGMRDGKTDGSSYLDIAEVLERVSLNKNEGLEQLFRRVVFDVAVSNQDNHLRNHGFMLNNGRWELSPAYDINPVHNTDFLDLYINLESGYRSFNNVIETCLFYHLSEEKAKDIIQNTTEIVAQNWQKLAIKYQIPSEEQKMMSSAFALAEKEAKHGYNAGTYSHKSSLAEQMVAKWYEFVNLPREEKIDGIIWNGEKMRLAVFDDMYLAQCQKEGVEPDKQIKEHFWKNCVEMQEYVPKFYINNNARER